MPRLRFPLGSTINGWPDVELVQQEFLRLRPRWCWSLRGCIQVEDVFLGSSVQISVLGLLSRESKDFLRNTLYFFNHTLDQGIARINFHVVEKLNLIARTTLRLHAFVIFGLD